MGAGHIDESGRGFGEGIAGFGKITAAGGEVALVGFDLVAGIGETVAGVGEILFAVLKQDFGFGAALEFFVKTFFQFLFGETAGVMRSGVQSGKETFAFDFVGGKFAGDPEEFGIELGRIP